MKINKPIAVLIGLFVILAVPILAAVIVNSFTVSVSVSEPLSLTDSGSMTLTDLNEPNAFPNQVITKGVEIHNIAPVSQNAQLVWVTHNVTTDGTYDISFNEIMPMTLGAVVEPDINTTRTVMMTLTIHGDSPVETIKGHIELQRV